VRMDSSTQECMTSAPQRFDRTEHGPVQGLSRGQISNRFVDLSLVNQSQNTALITIVGLHKARPPYHSPRAPFANRRSDRTRISTTSTSTLSLQLTCLKILDNALGAVGHTPLIRLAKIAYQEGLKCNLCKESNECIS